MLIEVLRAVHGEDGTVARQAYGAVVFVAFVVGIPLVTISGAIAYGMKRGPEGGREMVVPGGKCRCAQREKCRSR